MAATHPMTNSEIVAPPAAHRLAAIVESSDDVIVTKDLNGIVTSWNRGAERVFGYSAAEMLGQSITKVIPAELQHEEIEILRRIRAGEQIDHHETVRCRKDGRRIDISLTISPIRDDAGAIIGASKIARDVTDRRKADAMAYRLAAIVESSDDAIISKDLNGIIQSWNRGAERVFGYSEREAVGQHVTMLIPQSLRHEEDRIIGEIRAGARIEHYETIRRRKDGRLIDVALTISPIKDGTGKVIGASKIARDISERKQAEAQIARHKDRFETLNSIAKMLSADLDLERVADVTTEIATRLTGAKFGAFFYNVTDDKGERYLLYSLHGAPRQSFERMGMPRNTQLFDHTFSGRGPMRSGDIRKDPRYGKSAPHYGQPPGHLPVVSYLAVPVVSRTGEVIGGLFFAHHDPDVFDADAEELALGIAGHAAIAIDNARLHRAAEQEIARRKVAEETKEMLLHEIKHRVKNMLVTIDAVAAQSLRRADPRAAKEFSARIHALSQAHDTLTKYDWKDVDLLELARRSLSPFKEPGAAALSIEGPAVAIDANKSLLIALALHELATNSIKYGAWSVPEGRVQLSWSYDPTDRRAEAEWRESGGPEVKPPERRGFGSSLIERALGKGGGEATFDFQPSGLICRMTITV
ncbi:MAG: PAS domain S-box protein [Rhodospirillaceae bacterium]